MSDVPTSVPDQTYCRQENGIRFAGLHVLVEIWQGKHFTDPETIEAIMTEAITACGATMLKIDLHRFSVNGGVSGVAILAESHMSIHTWPEYEYAAMDIFVCGSVDPHKAVEVIRKRFAPSRIETKEIRRGILPEGI